MAQKCVTEPARTSTRPPMMAVWPARLWLNVCLCGLGSDPFRPARQLQLNTSPRRHGLAMTGGSDYHGKGALTSDTEVGDIPFPPQHVKIFADRVGFKL